MHNIMILGAGRMGTLTAHQLAQTGDYHIHLLDRASPQAQTEQVLKQTENIQFNQLNISDTTELKSYQQQYSIKTVVSCLPYTVNKIIIPFAIEQRLNYFDLTEDTASSDMIWQAADKIQSAFVPQCGIAPGFINIIANHLIQQFQSIDHVKLCVGALPLQTSNPLQYALTWSTEGVINEYANLCDIIDNGEVIQVPALDGLEELIIDGKSYEIFYTSGGVGSLIKTYKDKVKNLSYKTIRYPGHCDKIKFLMQEMQLENQREQFKHILEHTVPTTNEDIVLLYVTVSGDKDDRLHEMSFSQKFYSTTHNNLHWSAIQLTTTTALCCIIDIVLNDINHYQGIKKQEDFALDAVYNNRFGQYFKPEASCD